MNIGSREIRTIASICGNCAFAVGVVFVMGASHLAVAQQSDAASDSQLLSAILKTAESEAGRIELRVDPRPLIADATLTSVQPQAIATVSPSLVRLRTDVIRASGLRPVDATIVNQNSDCRGVLVIGQRDSLGVSNAHGGCPDKQFAVLAIGLPRRGKAILAGREVYDRDSESAARGYWAARIIQTSLGPLGSSVHASDYVLTKRAGKWVVVKVVGLMYTE
jgi:hypothetical protein